MNSVANENKEKPTKNTQTICMLIAHIKHINTGNKIYNKYINNSHWQTRNNRENYNSQDFEAASAKQRSCGDSFSLSDI